MKIFLTIFFTFFSLGASAQSPAEVISEYARACHAEVGTQASISLSQLYHSAEPGSQEEAEAKKALDSFNEELADFAAFETGCNESFDGVERFICYSQGYSKETKRIMTEYSVEYAGEATVTPECAYLSSVL